MLFGVYVTSEPSISTVPFEGESTIEYIKSSPSGSVPIKDISKISSSNKNTDCVYDTGLSLIAIIFNWKLAVEIFSLSDAVNVNSTIRSL